MEKNIVIGFDERLIDSFLVCEKSLGKKYKKEKTRNDLVTQYGSTKFTYSRFLVPFQMNYSGWSLFVDSDFVFLDDVENLFEYIDDRFAVMVCKHENYKPKSKIKMDGQEQSPYERKNWSSLILWNNSHVKNKILNPNFINETEGLFLHQFKWLNDEDIGSLPLEWNYLVGYYEFGNPKALHFTDGTPNMEGYFNCEYANEWLKLHKQL